MFCACPLIEREGARYALEIMINLRKHALFIAFGKLWKLKMPFSRIWKGLEKRGFFKPAMENVLDFYLDKF